MAALGTENIEREPNRVDGLAENPAKNDSRTNSTIDAIKTAEGCAENGVDTSARKSVRNQRAARESTKTRSAGKVDLTKEGKKAFAAQLVGVHKIAGIMLQMPEVIEISQEQSEAMIVAITDVLEQYKIKPNPRAVAWANLAGTLAMIYAPKIWLCRAVIAERKKQARDKSLQIVPTNNPPVYN